DWICLRTADAVTTGKMITRRVRRKPDATYRLKRLENGAHNGSREVGAHTFERIAILAEEGGGIERVRSALHVVVLTKHEAGIFPQHLVVAQILQFDPRDDRDRIARSDLARRETGGSRRRRCHLARQHGIDTGALRQNAVLAAADELSADLLRELRFQ